MKTVTVAYKTRSGFVKHILCSQSNPRNFKLGDKFIVLNDFDPKVKTVESEKQAEKLNHSIVNESFIRKVYE